MVLAVIFTNYDEEYDVLKQEVKKEADILKKIDALEAKENKHIIDATVKE
jgi:hypothetical protein